MITSQCSALFSSVVAFTLGMPSKKKAKKSQNQDGDSETEIVTVLKPGFTISSSGQPLQGKPKAELARTARYVHNVADLPASSVVYRPPEWDNEKGAMNGFRLYYKHPGAVPVCGLNSVHLLLRYLKYLLTLPLHVCLVPPITCLARLWFKKLGLCRPEQPPLSAAFCALCRCPRTPFEHSQEAHYTEVG